MVTMTLREVFEFVTDFDLKEEDLDDYLEKVRHHSVIGSSSGCPILIHLHSKSKLVHKETSRIY
jgi:hypothetical protein